MNVVVVVVVSVFVAVGTRGCGRGAAERGSCKELMDDQSKVYKRQEKYSTNAAMRSRRNRRYNWKVQKVNARRSYSVLYRAHLCP